MGRTCSTFVPRSMIPKAMQPKMGMSRMRMRLHFAIFETFTLHIDIIQSSRTLNHTITSTDCTCRDLSAAWKGSTFPITCFPFLYRFHCSGRVFLKTLGKAAVWRLYRFHCSGRVRKAVQKLTRWHLPKFDCAHI